MGLNPDTTIIPDECEVQRGLTDDEQEVIVQTLTENDAPGQKKVRLQVVYNPEGFCRMLIAMLASLDFSEADLTYIDERFETLFDKGKLAG